MYGSPIEGLRDSVMDPCALQARLFLAEGWAGLAAAVLNKLLAVQKALQARSSPRNLDCLRLKAARCSHAAPRTIPLWAVTRILLDSTIKSSD